MYTIQQQYNVVPGQYAKEMAAVLPHLKSIVIELVTYLMKPIKAVFRTKNNLVNHQKV
ncbi:MAG: hypothetical protein ACI8ZB_005019 [Desulforhopalus sp.]|jgi:hypothetical protein